MSEATRKCPHCGSKMRRDYSVCYHCSQKSDPPKVPLIWRIIDAIMKH
jgi:hypothetical protein